MPVGSREEREEGRAKVDCKWSLTLHGAFIGQGGCSSFPMSVSFRKTLAISN